MRPPSIVRFDRLFLAAIALWLIANLLDGPRTVAQVEASPQIAILGGNAVVLVAGMIAVLAAVALLLWHRVAWRGARWARIAVILFALVDTALFVTGLAGSNVAPRAATVAQMAAVVVQLLAIRALFRADARPWFRSEARKSAA